MYSTVTGDTSTESGSLQTTGKNENWQAKKIYDLAGNSYEWTMESNSCDFRVYRGRLLLR